MSLRDEFSRAVEAYGSPNGYHGTCHRCGAWLRETALGVSCLAVGCVHGVDSWRDLHLLWDRLAAEKTQGTGFGTTPGGVDKPHGA